MKISLCIVCMNRTMHLRESLPWNIKDNINYPDLEIVLLDYGSRDDMSEWVKSSLSPFIQSGLVRYFKNEEPEFFKISHAKNMAFKLATGDILCSVDADNYTGHGFVEYVNEQFSQDENIFLTAPPVGVKKKWWDVQGRICLWRKDFHDVRGYDENIIDYGYEDLDFKERLSGKGRVRTKIVNPDFLRAIHHDDHLRVAEGFSSKRLKEIIVGERCDSTYEAICLHKDNQFERFCIELENDCTLEDLNQLENPQLDGIKYLRHGDYENTQDRICLFNKNQSVFLHLRRTGNGGFVSDDDRRFFKLPSGNLVDKIMMERAIHVGRQKIKQNRKNPCPVNAEGFGRGIISVNFSNRKIVIT
jgi:glycosyltransferase involved in cell wall biosynthesis